MRAMQKSFHWGRKMPQCLPAWLKQPLLSKMAVEGRALEIRLDQVKAQSSRTNVQLDAVVKMSRAKERISPRSWVVGPAYHCHSVKLDIRAARLCLDLVEANLEGPAPYRHVLDSSGCLSQAGEHCGIFRPQCNDFCITHISRTSRKNKSQGGETYC